MATVINVADLLNAIKTARTDEEIVFYLAKSLAVARQNGIEEGETRAQRRLR